MKKPHTTGHRGISYQGECSQGKGRFQLKPPHSEEEGRSPQATLLGQWAGKACSHLSWYVWLQAQGDTPLPTALRTFSLTTFPFTGHSTYTGTDASTTQGTGRPVLHATVKAWPPLSDKQTNATCPSTPGQPRATKGISQCHSKVFYSFFNSFHLESMQQWWEGNLDHSELKGIS